MAHEFPWHGGKDIAFTPVGMPKTQAAVLDDEEPLADVVEPEERELTDEEVDQILNGDLSPLGLTAAAETSEHTGAMIALLPTIADQERLAVPGGEDEEELHLTLFYLGEAAKIPPNMRESILEMMAGIARNTPIVDGDGFAISTFNPDKPDKETCITLGVSGDELTRVHDAVASHFSGGYSVLPFPEQHSPWVPHVTLAYSNDASLAAQLTDRTGPIRFDVLRVVFAGQVSDFPLYDGTAKVDAVIAHGHHNQKTHGNRTKKAQSGKVLNAGPLTKSNETALAEYSSLTGYIDINDRLRTGAVPSYRSEESLDETIAQVRDSMRPLPNDQTVFRGVNISQFPGITDVSQLPDLVGETFRDEGFTSTSTEMIGRFVPKVDDVLMTIQVPKGYPHVDLAQNSEWTKEKELLLDAGVEFRVISATPPGKIPRWQLTLEVVPRD
jgi:2'-5' RNA ligase